METLVKYFNEITLCDLPKVGGKNASLGEMFRNLSGKGIESPDEISGNINEAEKKISSVKMSSL